MRQTFEAIVIIILFTLVSISIVFIAQPSTPNYKHLLAVSCMIEVNGHSGSGVLVTRRVGQVNRTFVWTAGHVAKEAQREDGTFGPLMVISGPRKSFSAKVIDYSEGEDLALLEIEWDNYTSDSAIFYSSDAPIFPGTELIHVGSVLGLCNSVSTGVMSRNNHIEPDGPEIYDQTSVMGYPGSLGGGVFLCNGQCIGLLVREAGPGINFIVPIRRMREWARKENIEWALDPTLPIPVQVKRPIDFT
jgi:S1-C subfamily serine protease